MINQYPVLRQRIATEWTNIQKAADKAQAAHAEATPYALDAAGLNLQGFYNGLERLFELIGRQIDNSIPEGGAWHRDLLKQMTLDVPGVRPSVISEATAVSLEDYLGFRHIVRNLYTWDLDPVKVNGLIERLPQLIAALDNDLKAFGRFLEAAGRADEV
ncbi:MAG: hypothetical protein R3D55_25715 [Chloroflexota bacterium]